MFSRPTLLLVLLAASGGTVSAQVNVTTYHNDTLRTGWNQQETVLNTTNVTSSNKSFGVLAQVTLDEQVDAQPLVFTTPGLTAVYVVTENNTVYEIDTATNTVRASVNLGASVPMSALPGKCNNNSQHVGITSTPVIDASTSTMYLVTYTLESGVPVYRLHALSLPTLSDQSVVITASHPLSDGTIDNFPPQAQRQRAALLEVNGTIYAAFTTFCDFDANISRGWVLGFTAGSLAPLTNNELTDIQTVLQTKTPPAVKPNIFRSSVWMSGYGVAADASGNLYFSTSNSDESNVDNFPESAIKLSGDLSTVIDYFTPFTFATLDAKDQDFGSGGLLVLPDQPGPVPHLAVTTGKSGITYIMNRDAMGGYTPNGPDKNLASITMNPCWCGPSYFVGSDGIGRVVTSGDHKLVSWKVNTSNPIPLSLEAQGSASVGGGQDAGFFTSISSNGTQEGSAIIWAVNHPTSLTNINVALHAYNATASGTTPSLHQLYSAIAGTWPNLTANANIVPTVANGQVYVASNQQLTIFGLNPPASPLASNEAMTPTSVTQTEAVTSEAQVFGTITDVDGNLIEVKLRTGRKISVDLTEAMNQFLSVIPVVGENVEVTGTLASDGSLLASVMLRVKQPETWGPDKP